MLICVFGFGHYHVWTKFLHVGETGWRRHEVMLASWKQDRIQILTHPCNCSKISWSVFWKGKKIIETKVTSRCVVEFFRSKFGKDRVQKENFGVLWTPQGEDVLFSTFGLNTVSLWMNYLDSIHPWTCCTIIVGHSWGLFTKQCPSWLSESKSVGIVPLLFTHYSHGGFAFNTQVLKEV